MNFFGHAAVACTVSDSPRFVLGSMLPDLSSMAAVRLGAALDPELARGVALHHETDRVFHAVPAFKVACSAALEQLEARGVSRASARAVGHVGSELLLDGLLSSDDAARAAYGRALRVALDAHLERAIDWRDGSDAERLHVLLARLAAAPLPQAYREPEFVCDRLRAILARRPRLALAPQDLEPVRDFLRYAAQHLARECDAIFAAVRDAARATSAG